ncbi:MAG: four helix bundle protein [Pirellulales bacterium]
MAKKKKREETKGTEGTKGTARPIDQLQSPESSLSSSPSFSSLPPDGFIPKHGGYRKLLSYQKAEILFDATVHFCNRFISRRDRTHDQMVQAARSGKQNIAEGSQASGTSKEMEIKLTNVARASLEELLRAKQQRQARRS